MMCEMFEKTAEESFYALATTRAYSTSQSLNSILEESMTLSLNCSLWAIPPPVLAPNHILSRAHHTRQRVSLTLHLFRDKAVCLRGFASEWLCIRFRTDSQKNVENPNQRSEQHLNLLAWHGMCEKHIDSHELAGGTDVAGVIVCQLAGQNLCSPSASLWGALLLPLSLPSHSSPSARPLVLPVLPVTRWFARRRMGGRWSSASIGSLNIQPNPFSTPEQADQVADVLSDSTG
eukprot:258860-Rhodomonas_salina.2